MQDNVDIFYFDLEIDPKSKKILEYGAISNDHSYRGRERNQFEYLIKNADTICGHNIINHDLPILEQYDFPKSIFEKSKIDTLYLSVLLFPKKPYHHLVKDYQLNGTELDNPLADAKLAKELLQDLLQAFHQLSQPLKTIYYSLLNDIAGFDGFFKLITSGFFSTFQDLNQLANYIKNQFAASICDHADLLNIIQNTPIEFAFALSIISVDDKDSLLPSWIKHQFPKTIGIVNQLRVVCSGNKGCPYCPKLSPVNGLQRFFGFKNFIRFEGDVGKPLQEKVVEAALANRSLVAIFPTGGGKSLTFQLPALMRGEADRSLTVIISPLQSLMKDQVDVLRDRHSITEAVTINGMLSPLERGEAIERVENGGANLLYISPESLRSNTIMRLLKQRVVDRFVIDEAHCFSSWGQDFRVDYLYIGKFLKKLQKLKGLPQPIPVSCFTATAKPAVVGDIKDYFQELLGLHLEVFQTNTKRKNLSYFVVKANGKAEKYEKLKELLQSEDGPKIVYVSRVKTSEELALNLQRDGIMAKAYNGKMDRDDKIRIQNEFMSIEEELDIIVATSAFGMGVDKDNIKMVVHYNISDSLENYVQESGRAGRQPGLQAKCYILFDNHDLDAHFNLLNLTKLSQKEVYQIWQGIKDFKRKKFTKSALEIAKKAGWDTEMMDLETRVKVAISALEESGYVVREENAPQIFAQSILVNSVEEAQQKMNAGLHHFISENQKRNADRIFSSLISRARAKDDTRVDSIAESLGIEKNEVTSILNIFKQIGILSNDKDLSAYFFTVQGKRNSVHVFDQVSTIENEMSRIIFPHENQSRKDIYLREINEEINEIGIDCDLVVIKDILNYWAQVNYVKKERIDKVNNQFRIQLALPYKDFKNQMELRLRIGSYCLKVLELKFLPLAKEEKETTDKKLLEFSVLDLKTFTEEYIENEQPIRFYEYILLYFHNLKIIELKDGLMVFYNPMKITRQIEDNRKRYTQEDYQQLARYYESKTEQIHIIGEYAIKQLRNNLEAAQFVEDYFSQSYDDFLAKYFNRRKGAIKKTITEEKFRELFSELSTEQLSVVKDDKHDNILVAAGPGSGKTRVLVHKVASLLLMEDVKPEQFLMLTFSRPAALEFKTRLKKLVGMDAYNIDIFTYHGFAFQLAGRLGDIEKSQNILNQVKKAIEKEEIPLDRIKNKSVVVVDEYQDVSQEEYDFLMAIVDCSEKIRVIVAGDDDQNIYEFRGSSIRFMRDFITRQDAQRYVLTKNYRANHNLLEFTNLFLRKEFSSARLKNDVELTAHKQRNGLIEIVRYVSSEIILPLIAHIENKTLEGTTAILTYKNEESVLMTSLLKQKGIPAILISDKQGFTLRDLLEIRTFTYFIFQEIKDDFGLIPEEKWEEKKRQLFEIYVGSKNIDLVERIIGSFEKTNPKKFKSTWNAYLKEIRVEDFYHPEKETILVSTMHKSKGKEFDNVFILLNNFPLHAEEKKRVLYVAMTRAKENLFIHTNNISFPMEGVLSLKYREDKVHYNSPDTLIVESNMKDVWLGYFKNSKIIYNVKSLKSGDTLLISQSDDAILQDTNYNNVLRFSNSFQNKITNYLNGGYQLESAHVKYIIVWYDKESGKHFRVVLPELVLKKT
jgi:ATP-dependent DNA helicase RecQ